MFPCLRPFHWQTSPTSCRSELILSFLCVFLALYYLIWASLHTFVPNINLYHFQQPNARKEDLFGRPSQGLYSSSYMATKGLAEASMDRNCLEVNMGSSLPSPSQVYHPSSLNKHAGSSVQISKHINYKLN